MTEKRKAEKQNPIRTRGKTEADKRNVPLTTTASSDWLPLFRQGEPGLTFANTIIRERVEYDTSEYDTLRQHSER